MLNETADGIAPGASAHIDFSADDTLDEEDGDLGSHAAGIVCSLPMHVLIADTYVAWDDEDGIESNAD